MAHHFRSSISCSSSRLIDLILWWHIIMRECCRAKYLTCTWEMKKKRLTELGEDFKGVLKKTYYCKGFLPRFIFQESQHRNYGFNMYTHTWHFWCDQMVGSSTAYTTSVKRLETLVTKCWNVICKWSQHNSIFPHLQGLLWVFLVSVQWDTSYLWKYSTVLGDFSFMYYIIASGFVFLLDSWLCQSGSLHL